MDQHIKDLDYHVTQVQQPQKIIINSLSGGIHQHPNEIKKIQQQYPFQMFLIIEIYSQGHIDVHQLTAYLELCLSRSLYDYLFELIYQQKDFHPPNMINIYYYFYINNNINVICL